MLARRAEVLTPLAERIGARPLIADVTDAEALNSAIVGFADPEGIDLDVVKDLKEVRRRRISDYLEHRPKADYKAGATVWEVPCEAAFPSATQNELNLADARQLIANGVVAVAEGANMPCTPDAVRAFQAAGVAFGPGKAANAGGVATSALEMQQNASRDSWSFEHTEQRLAEIMAGIHDLVSETADEFGGSIWQQISGGGLKGLPPKIDLANEERLADFTLGGVAEARAGGGGAGEGGGNLAHFRSFRNQFPQGYGDRCGQRRRRNGARRRQGQR